MISASFLRKERQAVLACLLLWLPTLAPGQEVRTPPVSMASESDAALDADDVASMAGRLQGLESMVEAGGPGAFRAAAQLRQTHADLGNAAKAMIYAKRQLALAQGPGQTHLALSAIVNLNSSLHQLDEGRTNLAQLEKLTETLRGHRRFGEKKDWWQAGLARAHAALETQSGHLEKAEQAWQACITAIRASVASNPDREGSLMLLDCSRGLLGVKLATGQIDGAAQVADQMRSAAERVVELRNRPSVMIRVNQALARLALEQGRLDQSEAIIRSALSSIAAGNREGISLRAVGLYKMLAEIEMLRARWPRALEVHKERESLLRSASADRGNFGFYSVEYAYTLVRLNQAAQAIEVMQNIVAARSKIYDENSLNLWEARGFLGVALAAGGRRDEALAMLRDAMPKILDIAKGERSSNEAGVLRTARLNWLLDGYLHLLAEPARAGNQEALDEAFRMADLARGSTVQRALAASVTRANISDPALSELARKEQDLQREISALADAIGNLLARGRVQDQDKVVTDMRKELARLRSAHGATQVEIEKRFPSYSALLNPRPVGIRQVQASLRPDEALVSVFLGSAKTMVWAIPHTGAPKFAASDLDNQQAERMITALRNALDPVTAAGGRLPDYPFETAHELYRHILAPVESGWKGARELIVVPHGRLGQLPFSVLTTDSFKAPASQLPYAGLAGAPWLIKRVAISQLPAVIALPSLRAVKARRADRAFVGFGDPVFMQSGGAGASTRGAGQLVRRNLVIAAARPTQEPSPGIPPAASVAAPAPAVATPASIVPASANESAALAPPIDFSLLPPLPDTALEIRDVAAVLGADPNRDIFLNTKASETRVKTADLAPYRVVMFATHGLMSGEMPGLNQPALALSNPAISGDGGDGMLTLEEILGLRLNADWVVLSACNSGAGTAAGEESVSGLGRAFFYAGAKSLLVTGWAVETESARLLTTETFRMQSADRMLSRSRALQKASLDLMGKSAGGSFSYAHPMFWAPYMLVGDGS